MDLQIFLLINGWAGRSTFLDAVMVFCAHYLVYVLVAALLVYVGLEYRKRWSIALVALVSAVIARYVVASGIRYFYIHPRPGPDVISVPFHLLLVRETDLSFPSGHTIFLFALATVVYRYNKKAGWWFYAGAFIVGFARVFVGVHWPYDIIGGIVLGILTGWICDAIFQKYKHLVGL